MTSRKKSKAERLPMSLRSAAAERAYQKAAKDDKLTDVRKEMVVEEFKQWLLIRNRYPYDAVFSKHDLLIPKRDFATRGAMLPVEYFDLMRILETYGEQNYDGMIDNMQRRRSIMGLYHVHLFCYKDRREEIDFEGKA